MPKLREIEGKATGFRKRGLTRAIEQIEKDNPEPDKLAELQQQVDKLTAENKKLRAKLDQRPAADNNGSG